MAVATPPTIAPPAERRAAVRRKPAQGTICRIARGPAGAPAVGLIWNISRSGVSMLMSAAPDVGAELAGVLETIEGGHALRVDLEVVHARPIATGDFLVGAAFDRQLTADEMEPFVA